MGHMVHAPFRRIAAFYTFVTRRNMLNIRGAFHMACEFRKGLQIKRVARRLLRRTRQDKNI